MRRHLEVAEERSGDDVRKEMQSRLRLRRGARQLLIGEKSFEARIRHRRQSRTPRRARKRSAAAIRLVVANGATQKARGEEGGDMASVCRSVCRSAVGDETMTFGRPFPHSYSLIPLFVFKVAERRSAILRRACCFFGGRNPRRRRLPTH